MMMDDKAVRARDTMLRDKEVRTFSELWFECRLGRHSLCKSTSQYEANDIANDKPATVIQQCSCACHSRIKTQ